ncbi:MAG: hypothetical protein K2P94_10895 [Rhodospirillaceae bacterium]|nr:hypothetical protein [Rhodospirillaceae bacterium]
MTELDRRDHFLIALYNQLMNDINRHIIVVWQSVATLVAAIAAFGLVEKNVISMDVAISMVLLSCIWLVQHVYDASHWYNRNLAMIANIERQFLKVSDLKDVHYYFGAHRPSAKIISHLRIQRLFGYGVAALVLLLHLQNVMLPIFRGSATVSLLNLAPWGILIVGFFVVLQAARDHKNKYEEFIKNSPGIPVDATGITYGVGHGFDGKPRSK